MTETPTDWRGTPIVEGARCIYGAPLGRSISLVEAEVVGFTKTGRVNVRILRRARGGTWSEREVVHVGADRLVVVGQLPPSDVPLTSEAVAARKAATAERARVRATHDFREEVVEDRPGDRWSRRLVRRPCSKCGAQPSIDLKECPGAIHNA